MNPTRRTKRRLRHEGIYRNKKKVDFYCLPYTILIYLIFYYHFQQMFEELFFLTLLFLYGRLSFITFNFPQSSLISIESILHSLLRQNCSSESLQNYKSPEQYGNQPTDVIVLSAAYKTIHLSYLCDEIKKSFNKRMAFLEGFHREYVVYYPPLNTRS